MTRVGDADMAVPHPATGPQPASDERLARPGRHDANIARIRETYDAFRPSLAEGRWLNDLGDDEQIDAVRAAHSPNYERLAQVKREYDPDNVFHPDQNIEPASG